MFPPARAPPDARILKRREYEERLAAIQSAVKEDSSLGAAAAWELKTDRRIRDLAAQKRLEQLCAQRTAELDARRGRLAQQLAAEEQQLRQELLASQETPAQRRAAMAARAREMAVRREAERQKLANDLMEAAFRENCDPLRERNSHARLQRTMEERERQVQERIAQHMVEEEEARLVDDACEVDRLRKEARHQEELRRRQESAGDIKRSLDVQVAAVQGRLEAEALLEAQELQRLREHWAALEAEAEAAEQAERVRLQQLAEEVKAFNELKLMQLSEQEREEREQDLAILQQALARETADEAVDLQRREDKRVAVQHYRRQLALMAAKQEADASEQDAAIEAALRVQQAKQDGEWAARAEARRRLMAEVDQIRQQQIAAKEHARRLAREQQKLDLLQLREDEAAAVAEREAAQRALRKKAMVQQLGVQAQVMARAHLRAAEQEEKQHAAALAAASEQRYLQRVEVAERTVAPQAYYGRKKVEWFH